MLCVFVEKFFILIYGYIDELLVGDLKQENVGEGKRLLEMVLEKEDIFWFWCWVGDLLDCLIDLLNVYI